MRACVAKDRVTLNNLRTNADQVLRHTRVVTYVCGIHIHRVRTSLVLRELEGVVYAQEADRLVSDTVTILVVVRLVLEQVLRVVVDTEELQVNRSVSGRTEGLRSHAIEAAIQRSVVLIDRKRGYTDLSDPLIVNIRLSQIQSVVVY